MTASQPTQNASASTGIDIPQRVMTIGAHPDDAEFGAGATLARWASDGAIITMVVVTDGSKGSWDKDIDQQALIQTRIDEQTRSVDVLGAHEAIHLGHIDGELEHTMQLRVELATLIREHKPDVVLTHDPWQKYQLHPDHRVTGLASLDAVVSAREPLAMKHLELSAHRPATVLLWSAEAPDHAEKLNGEWSAKKIEALMCHVSQGMTTMGSPETSSEKLQQFADKIHEHHTESGRPFGCGPAETFKLIAP